MTVFKVTDSNCKGILKNVCDHFRGYRLRNLNLNEFIRTNSLDMVLNNDIIEVLDFDLYNYETLLKAAEAEIIEENPEAPEDEIQELATAAVYETDVYQYFIVSEYDVKNYWLKYTDYPVYYNSETEMYLLGITHYGMSWSKGVYLKILF